MYLARFSYEILPVNRQIAIDFIRREVQASRAGGHQARLLVPLTRGEGGPGLQFEVEVGNLEEVERFRHQGVGSDGETRNWMHAFSEILLCPPQVEILRVDDSPS